MFAGIVLLYFYEVFLSVRANLNDVLSADVTLYLFPGTTVFLQCVKEQLMFFVGPVFAVLGNDVLLARLFCWWA